MANTRSGSRRLRCCSSDTESQRRKIHGRTPGHNIFLALGINGGTAVVGVVTGRAGFAFVHEVVQWIGHKNLRLGKVVDG